MNLYRLAMLIMLSLLAISLSCQKNNDGAPAQKGASDKVKTEETSDSQITGISWRLLEIQSMDDSKQIPDNSNNYTLLLNPDGKVNIKADCNSGFGNYTLEGGALTMEIAGLTRAMCPPESLSEEYVKSLNQVYGYILKDGYLYLSMRMDSGILKFEKIQ